MTDFETWFLDKRDNYFRICKYKKVFTPREIDEKYIDQSIYEDIKIVKFVEAIELPDKDILLKMIEIFEVVEYDEDNCVVTKMKFGTPFYEKLSDICIEDYIMEEEYD